MPKKLEDVAAEVLRGDSLKNALDFVAYLRELGVPVEESDCYWEISYKGRCVCFIWIDGADQVPGPWTVWSAQGPDAIWENNSREDLRPEDGIKEIAWANVNVCGNCGGCDTPGGTRKTVLGREFEHLCNSALAFRDPDAAALECVKKMVEARLGDIG